MDSNPRSRHGALVPHRTYVRELLSGVPGTVAQVPHASDSAAQQAAELLMLAAVSLKVSKPLKARRLPVGDAGGRCDVDGVADDLSVLVEAFAHQGPMKSGQRAKVARDALKLVTLARSYPDARLILALADEECARPLQSTTWLAAALQTFGVEVMVVDLRQSTVSGLVAAQALQGTSNTAAPVG